MSATWVSDRRRGTSGFTLVELLLVVLTIGIVAVVAIPKFIDSAREARESALRADLATMRKAVELYYHQHAGTYPGAASHTGGTGLQTPSAMWANFHAQMTQYSNSSGKTSEKLDRAAYRYGPYLKHGIPTNQVFDHEASGKIVPDSVKVVASDEELSPDGPGAKAGWIFNCTTGELISNSDNSNDDMMRIVDF